MNRVFVLMKHPTYPYGYNNGHIRAGEIQGVYAERAEPDRIAAEKNARRPLYFWKVHAKKIQATKEQP